jgi:hypothetical protein
MRIRLAWLELESFNMPWARGIRKAWGSYFR